MRKINESISFFLFLIFFRSIIFPSAGANSAWEKIQKKIAISRGSIETAWIDRGTLVTMEPVGDGTFQCKLELYPNSFYNFLFFGVTDSSPPAGLLPNTTYYDAVPSFGSDVAFIISTCNVIVQNIGEAGYINIGGDSRRYIIIPDVPDGTTVYVYSNWASTPQAPANFRARPGDKKAYLFWDYPYSYWGKIEQGKAIDVIVGGVYHIFRATNPQGPYSLIATLPGYTTSYIDSGLTNGQQYFYTIISSDCYRGRLNFAQGDINLTTISPYEEPPPVPNLAWVTPNVPVPVRFYIYEIDLKKIKEKDFLVYLTPENETDIYTTSRKIQARFTSVYLRKTPRDYRDDFLNLIDKMFGDFESPPVKKKTLPHEKYAGIILGG